MQGLARSAARQPPGAPGEGRYDAFLCYAREDSRFALEVVRAPLQARGKTVWVDVEDIFPGSSWRERVRRGIQACRAVMFVITPASVASEQCREELDEAVVLNKLIIPIAREEVDNDRLPRAAADAEWVFL